MKKHRGIGLFERYVLDPVPQSVVEIRVNRDKIRLRYGYVFRFNIDEAGLDMIVRSRPFAEAQLIRCKPGVLDWEWKGRPLSGVSMSVYRPPQRRPSWFTPEAWENPKAYAFRKEGDDANTQLLLYNSELKRAYFVIHSKD